MAVVVSFINMKGGVGKTAIAAQLALYASSVYDYRSLAVDLDPQANLSQALLGPIGYRLHLEAEHPTIANVLEGYLPPKGRRGSPHQLEIRQAIRTRPVSQNAKLDLLPSHFELSYTLKQQSSIGPKSLARALSGVEKDYDLVIIDCAPTESILTEVAYHASRYVVVPVRPEYLATIGLPLLERSLTEFQKRHNRRHTIEVVGVLINHAVSAAQQRSHPESRQSVVEIRSVAANAGWHVFNVELPNSRTVPNAIRAGRRLSRTAFSSRSPALLEAFPSFCNELFQRIRVRGRESS
jgi:chromosome partitioning protein